MSRSVSPTTLSVDSSAASTVSRFYDAVAHHDAATARGLLSPTARAFEDHAVAPLWGPNTVSLTEFRIESVRADPNDAQISQPGFQDTTQVTVSFNAVYKDEGHVGASSGPTTNFVYVGRSVAGSEWSILSVGSGP